MTGCRRGIVGSWVAAAVAVALTAGGCGDGSSADGPVVPDVPPPVASALVVPTPRPLGAHVGTIWAPVLRAVPVTAAPGVGAAAVGSLDAQTPEGTANIVLVEARRRGVGGRVWVKVRLASRERATGWVPRAALGGYGTVDTRAVVDLGAQTLTLQRDGVTVFEAPVGVGTPDAPTPTGSFYIRNKLTRYTSAAYGPLAFGTSAQSPTLTDWPAGGYIGIHGTDRPDLLPGRVSHGCIRMRNEDIVRLASLLPVGTPLRIL